MARPRKEEKDKKRTMSITVNKDLNEDLEKFLIDNNLSKSEYVEYLIKKDMKNEMEK